jgi:antitoxin ParD1/3/4
VYRTITVSVPGELVAQAEAAVASGRAPSVSAYVSQALGEKSRHDRLIEVLDEMDRELGPPSRGAQTWTRQVLGL